MREYAEYERYLLVGWEFGVGISDVVTSHQRRSRYLSRNTMQSPLATNGKEKERDEFADIKYL